ncbi:hypothetical protein [uncultured Rikenella sp.]|uniref:hypothetical protein n=1 Tax=uncultured Rikenella sp. TaxID=368003 RepID=UPI002620069B|nr:hypothetical protein [uncultured Rikenella sp.]
MEMLCGRAPGFRDPGHHGQFGNAIYIGNFGYSWSSAVSDNNSVYLNFNATGIDSCHADSRGHGFPLRCLSE